MAHLVETMAYAGAAPWHGLGNQLTQKQPIDVWQREAGMDWKIQESPVHFKADTIGSLGTIHSFPEQKVLFRSDTKAPLSVVSQRYHTVQPREVLEFYRDLTEVSGYELETAGVLKGGRKFWALARTGQGSALKGNDQVNGYLLLATSCDGTLATTATPTTVRVVCNNTLTIALDGTSRAIKVPHNTRFDPKVVKKQLGIAVSQWDDFMYRMRALAERKVQWHEALGFFMNVLCETNPTGALPEVLPNERALRKVQELYEGRGRGSQLDSARGTAWGLLNSVTEFVDHERRARSNEYRMDSAWFGQGAQIKQRALDTALQLVACAISLLGAVIDSLKGAQLDDCTLNSPTMRNQLAERLCFDRSRRRKAERGLETQLLPDDAFQWIQKDGRQTDWLAAQARTKAAMIMMHPPFTTMTGRRLVIAIFDLWQTDIRTKELHLRTLEQEWNEHLQSDRIFRWFKQENEKEKCSLAWDWIEKNKPSMIRGKKPFTSHRELLAFFDLSSARPDEKVLYVDKIKRRWSTQKTREKATEKKQYNFVLTHSVNAALDKLAEKHQLSRTKILEMLLLSEAEHGRYLSPEQS